MQTLDEALESFPGEVITLIIIGENGVRRVWLNNGMIETSEQAEWVKRQAQCALTTLDQIATERFGQIGQA